MPLLLEIITPDCVVYRDTADSIVIPTDRGEVGILPGHIPLVTLISAGALQVTNKGQTQYLAVDDGLAQIMGDKVSILTEQAINVVDIDWAAVESARDRAQQALEEARRKGLDPVAVEAAENILRFAMAQRLLKDGRRGRH